ncbi:hypothetical protein JTE90_012026 [Oedothorax gibbosus]|uniref:Uncharacterized protein n=1 Tax=Oedothorax gibbosus TaxID=931172 RepID=A0AAV6UE36_9ARAC|nr:hypothetical protein JTE90_012026 [Oedothorax gibbosus]
MGEEPKSRIDGRARNVISFAGIGCTERCDWSEEHANQCLHANHGVMEKGLSFSSESLGVFELLSFRAGNKVRTVVVVCVYHESDDVSKLGNTFPQLQRLTQRGFVQQPPHSPHSIRNFSWDSKVPLSIPEKAGKEL